MGHVILLYPHHGRKRPHEIMLPLSLLYVAAPLVDAGYKVTVIDQRMESDWRETLRRALYEPRTSAVGISTMTAPRSPAVIHTRRSLSAT